MTHLLDTNVCIYLKRRRPPPSVVARFEAMSPGDLGISSVTLAELEYGVSKSGRSGDREVLDELLQLLVIVPFDALAARHCGDIRAHLERQGTPIGPFDLQIAAHARSLGVTLMTHDTREFARVPGLKLEDWHAA